MDKNKTKPTNDNIVKFKKPRMSREQRRKVWVRILATIGILLTLGGLVFGCLYSLL